MPTFLREKGFRFSVFANECDEPPHIHVRKGEADAKFWLISLRITYNHGFLNSDLKAIEKILKQRQDYLLNEWNRRCTEIT